MGKTIESTVANHQAASERRLAGRPVWDRKLSAVRVDGAPFKVNRDAFAAALENSAWLKQSEDFGELWTLWDEIKDADDIEHFDSVLDAIYDLADEERVWLTFEHRNG